MSGPNRYDALRQTQQAGDVDPTRLARARELLDMTRSVPSASQERGQERPAQMTEIATPPDVRTPQERLRDPDVQMDTTAYSEALRDYGAQLRAGGKDQFEVSYTLQKEMIGQPKQEPSHVPINNGVPIERPKETDQARLDRAVGKLSDAQAAKDQNQQRDPNQEIER